MNGPVAKKPSRSITAETIGRVLAEYEVELTTGQVQQLQLYLHLLLKWNERISLTAIRDPLEILYRHFGESMYAAIVVPVKDGRLADLGSGAGFPGLPLKVLRPNLEVFLVESNVRKATFLAEVIRELDLSGVTVLVNRFEELSEEVAPLDFVCSRAVGEFKSLLNWAAADAVAAKKVLLWIGGRDLDIARQHGSWIWREPFAIPHSLRRYILAGERSI